VIRPRPVVNTPRLRRRREAQEATYRFD
jgi:hypothetical protein